MKILVTGATGYIGNRFIPLLLQQGYEVKAMSRSMEKLQGRDWATSPQVELYEGDALNKKLR